MNVRMLRKNVSFPTWVAAVWDRLFYPEESLIFIKAVT
jgi:hypothetical protein